MPAQMPVVGVVRATFQGVADGVAVNNVMHVKGVTGSSWSQSDINVLGTQLGLKWISRFIPLINSRYLFTGVVCQDLTSTTGVTSVTAASTAGSMISTNTINSTAQCISWKTAAHFRGGHARTYLFGPNSASMTNGTTFVGTHVTNLQTAAQGFIADVAAIAVAGPPALVMVRRFVNNAVLTTPLAYVITDAVVDSRIDTQRRRLGKDR